MVHIWRTVAFLTMGNYRCTLLLYNYCYSCWDTMFQVCFVCFLALWQRCIVFQWRGQFLAKCYLDIDFRLGIGNLILPVWAVVEYHYHWHPFWSAIFQICKNRFNAFWLTYHYSVPRINQGKHTWQAGHGGTHSCKNLYASAEAEAYKSLVWETSPNPFNTDFICGYVSFRR